MMSPLRPDDVRSHTLLLLPQGLVLLSPDALAALFRAFSRFVELLAVSFFRLPFCEPNFSRPLLPRAIDAMYSS